MLPVEHRAKLSRAKLFRKIRGNTKHPLYYTINRRQRNGWTTEIQECHRLASTQLEEPTQLQRDVTAPWEQLPYEYRIDCTRELTEILKQDHYNTFVLNHTTTRIRQTIQVTGHGWRQQLYIRKQK